LPVQSVRERAPLRLHHLIETPSGKTYRWGVDEPDPANVPSGVKFSDGVPGGFDQFDCVLPRKPAIEYGDLERLSTLTTYGAGGEVAWQGRLERAPRVSGAEFSVAPNCVGWQAHLEDDKSAQPLYVDRDLGNWQTPSRSRAVSLYSVVDSVQDGSTEADETDGLPSIKLTANGTWATGVDSEFWYDAGSQAEVASVYYDYVARSLGANYTGRLNAYTDDTGAGEDTGSDVVAGASSTGTTTETPTTPLRYVAFQLLRIAASAAEGDRDLRLRNVTVWGNGATKQGTAPDDGVYASDVVAHALSNFAPLLRYTTGANGSVKPTSFIIPHLAFRDPTSAAEIVKQANRFHIRDWAVWENRTFYYHDRGDRGRSWRARVGPASLEETGPQADRIYNGVFVTYRDVDGSAKTVGPTGSGAHTESDELLDDDSDNPANALGIRKWAMLDMGIVSTPAGATEVGARFLAESRQLDRSGKATLTGHVEDDKGILRPYWQVRAGDTISFVDASDASERRIVKTTKDESSRSCEVELDAPPEGMEALLERLGVVLVEFGL
jgi:hypothetical protein